MTVSAGADYNYSLVPGTAVVNQRSATLHGQGATVVVANWGTDTDTTTKDTVNLASDLSKATGTTETSKLTAALGALLQTATHVDPQTGVREINQGAGDKLASEVGKLLLGSGFSKSDASDAAASLAKQFASATSGSDVVALSLSVQSQNVGGYTEAVDGGTEASAYAVSSTSTLNLTFNTGTGDLSVELDEHKTAMTRIEWSGATPTDVSIALKQPELDAIGFTPVGTFNNDTGSAIKETQTTSSQYVPGMGIGSSNVTGPNALQNYLNFESGTGSPSTTSAAASATAALPQAGTKTLSSAELALAALKQIVAQARSAQSQANHSVQLSVAQQLGTAVRDPAGRLTLLFNRADGDTASIQLPAVSIKA